MKTFLVTKWVDVGAVELHRGWFCRKFQASADFEVESGVVGYFSCVVKTFLNQVLVQNVMFVLLLGVARWCYFVWGTNKKTS